MNKIILKGFGCFAIFQLFSFTVKGNGPQDGFDNSVKDTSIAATEIVASAVTYPSAKTTVTVVKEEDNLETNVPAAISNNEILVARQNMFKQLHPMSVSFVQAYQKRNSEKLEQIKTKFSRQFSLIDNIMAGYELPKELKYLAIIESELSNRAVSCKGAVGAWQFMSSTGRLMGLTISNRRDERRDLVKSTHAAAKYLKSLYSQFNDWLLVIAAYNGGASRVEYAIKKSNSRDFWKLQYYLPAESRAHVKKFVAARYVLEFQDAENVMASRLLNLEKLTEQDLNNSAVLRISGKYNSLAITKSIGMDMDQFNLYNPGFDKEVVSQGYDMRLPKDKMELFNNNRQDILNQSIQLLLNENNTIVGTAENKTGYPEALSLPKSKAISTEEVKKMKRK